MTALRPGMWVQTSWLEDGYLITLDDNYGYFVGDEDEISGTALSNLSEVSVDEIGAKRAAEILSKVKLPPVTVQPEPDQIGPDVMSTLTGITCLLVGVVVAALCSQLFTPLALFLAVIGVCLCTQPEATL